MTAKHDILQLRNILLGKEYDELIHIKNQFENSDQYSAQIAEVIAEALTLRSKRDSDLVHALSPVIEKGINKTINDNPRKMVGLLYPVILPAIRKSINQTLTDMISSFNTVLRNGISLKAIKWRFDAWRTGYTYAQIVMMHSIVYQVEQVFFIHRDSGFLIEHVTSDNAIIKNEDTVSGILSAVQSFIRDSFSVDDDEQLTDINMGDITILVEHAPHAVIALVVRGTIPTQLHTQLRESSEYLHDNYGIACRDFSGDTSAFDGVSDVLQSQLLKKEIIKTEAPVLEKDYTKWLPHSIAVTTISIAIFFIFQEEPKSTSDNNSKLRNQALLTDIKERLQQEPGITLLNTKKLETGYYIKGLVDLEARRPNDIIDPIKQEELGLVLDFDTYLSTDEVFLLERAKKILSPPESVSLHIENRSLYIRGSSSQQWFESMQAKWRLISGLEKINTDNFSYAEANYSADQNDKKDLVESNDNIINAIKQLHSQYYLFEVGKSQIDMKSHSFQSALKNIERILRLANTLGFQVQITLVGDADTLGSYDFNKKLASQRARNMRAQLIQQGIPESIVLAYGSRDYNVPTTVKKNLRRVSYQVIVF